MKDHDDLVRAAASHKAWLDLLERFSPKQRRDLAALLDDIDTREVAPQSKLAPLYLPSYSNVYGGAPVQVLLQPSGINAVP